jgi:SAM-dependent methyltransferase
VIGRLVRALRRRGLRGVMRAVDTRMRELLAIRAGAYAACADRLRGRKGLEIGGPSRVFARRNVFPVYPIAGELDNCNFSTTTVWEGTIERGRTFEFDRARPAGRQFVAEAVSLDFVASGAYDFVLSSHMLEHCANPILALTEWIRVLKDEGLLVLLLPHKDRTFDHRRPVTTLAHLIADFESGTAEDDLTHLPEILALHDLERDPEAGDPAAFRARSLRNAENRCLHHHVFDMRLALALVDHVGLRIVAAEEVPPMHLLVVAQKPARGCSPDNSSFFRPT